MGHRGNPYRGEEVLDLLIFPSCEDGGGNDGDETAA